MRKVMGGFFEIDPGIMFAQRKQPVEKFFGLRKGQYQLVNSGRGCLSYVLECLRLQSKRILIPDYLCADVLIPVLQRHKCKYELFPVRRDFFADADVLRSQLAGKKFEAVLLINYFGLVDNREIVRRIKRNFPKVMIIQDCVQDPFYLRRVAASKQVADYVFTSFRKSCPVVDGGCVRAKEEELKHNNMAEGNTAFFQQSLIAAFLKQNFIASEKKKLNEGRYLEYFNEANGLLDNEPRTMTAFSREYLDRMDLARDARRRRSNYLYTVDRLKEIEGVTPVWEKLPAGSVPLFCPVYVQGGRRNRLRKYLQAHKIFCPVHWPVPKAIDRRIGPDARWMSGNMLSLVIDQRYQKDDLDRMIRTIKKFQRSLN